MVVWITGLSGAGKTTLAKAVAAGIRRRGLSAIHLDGDAVRKAIDDPHVGYDRESRIRNARRISHLAALLERQGLVVVVSTMSLFHEIHDLNRSLFGAYFEVFLQVDVETLKRRDARGLYSRAAKGHETNVAGVDLAAEFPREPHLVISNDEHRESLSASPHVWCGPWYAPGARSTAGRRRTPGARRSPGSLRKDIERGEASPVRVLASWATRSTASRKAGRCVRKSAVRPVSNSAAMDGAKPEYRMRCPVAREFQNFEGKTAPGKRGSPATRWISADQYE
ncbi:MAG: adenylyl-sulfate kinase [Holophagales bacterium]|nr:adenylyl-sulfate kinase [Holophagales bacterium]